jgi:hypothetical protein
MSSGLAVLVLHAVEIMYFSGFPNRWHGRTENIHN